MFRATFVHRDRPRHPVANLPGQRVVAGPGAGRVSGTHRVELVVDWHVGAGYRNGWMADGET